MPITHNTLTTISTQFKKWLLTRLPAQNSQQKYIWIINNFLSFLEKLDIFNLKDVSKDLLLKFVISKRSQQYKPSYIRLRFAALNLFFLWAQDKKYCYENLVVSYRKTVLDTRNRGGKKITLIQDSISVLSPCEQQIILNTNVHNEFVSIRNKCIISLILATGLFAEELLRLPLANFHLKQGIIKIDNVDVRSRNVKIDLLLCKKSCNDWLRARKNANSSLLFCTEQGTPISMRLLYNIVSQYLITAGIHKKHNGPDLLRQTAITNMLTAGKSLEEIQENTGIKTLVYLDKYKKCNTK